MQNSEIAGLFEELAALLEIDGANPFRVRAYRTAARTISGLTESLVEMVDEGDRDLTELPGIGKDLAGKIADVLETGELEPLHSGRRVGHAADSRSGAEEGGGPVSRPVD